MRLFTIFLKTVREFSRDWWVLGLSLAFAPFFVFLYWVWFQGGSTSYTVLVINHDQGATLATGERLQAGEAAIAAVQAVQYADGRPLLLARPVADRLEAEKLLRKRSGVMFIEFPENFSQAVAALQAGDRSVYTQVVFGGDLTNVYYSVGAALALTAVDGYVFKATGQQPLLGYQEQPLGASAARSEFETYVPGTLIFAVIMMIFLAAMTVAREIEAGTLLRLKITLMSAFDLLGGISLALVGMGLLSVLLTFAVAQALGFHSQGPVWVAALVGAVTSLSIIGMGMLVASFSGSVSQAFIIANFPMGLMMFFSGAIFPMPKATLFTIGEQAIGLYDILPATHAVNALTKVLTLGAGFGDVVYELGMLLVLSLIYFGVGVWLFERRYLR